MRREIQFLVVFSALALVSDGLRVRFGGGGGWRSGSSGRTGGGWSRSSSSSRVTSSPYRNTRVNYDYNHNSYANARPTVRSYATSRPTQYNFATSRPTQSSFARPTQIGHYTTPRTYVHQAASPSYRDYRVNQASHRVTTPSYRMTTPYRMTQRYPSNSFTSVRPIYSSRNNYDTHSSRGNSYPKQSYGYPNYQASSPYYSPSYSKYPNLYQPSYGKHKDHSVRNSIIAGLGGSALGMYLGYKLGSYTSGLHQPYGMGYGMGYNNYGGGNYGGGNFGGGAYGGGSPAFPPYSVVHHYHHGEKTIPQQFEVKQNTISQCGNMTDFCPPGTTPLCMTNGTIYCVAPLSLASNCNETKLTSLPCVNTTISVPCVNTTDVNCNGTVALNETVALPCVSRLNVYGDFGSNRLEVHSISGDLTAENDTSITGDGISSRYCVTVIADPVKIPPNMTNDEFMMYLDSDPVKANQTESKIYGFFGQVLNFLFA